MIRDIQDNYNFEDFIKVNKFSFIVYGADWCDPCKRLKDKLKEKQDELKNLSFGYINVDKLQNLANDYQVNTLPTQILFDQNQNEICRIEGYNFDKIVNMYKNYCDNSREKYLR